MCKLLVKTKAPIRIDGWATPSGPVCELCGWETASATRDRYAHPPCLACRDALRARGVAFFAPPARA